MNTPISVIIPVYNSAKYLNALLDDIINQTFSEFEVIIVNDGSSDNSQEIIEEFAKKDVRIKGIYTENAGVAEARNRGLAMATGEYIRFVDADDRLPADSLQIMYETVKNDEKIDLVIGSFETVPESNLYYGEHSVTGKQTLEKLSTDLLFNVQSFYYGVVWNKLFKREVIEQNDIKFCKDITWGEDYFFNLDYYKHCQYIYVIPSSKKIYSYYQNASSITKTLDKLPSKQIDDICQMRIDRAKELFDRLGMGDKLELEWKYAFIFSGLYDVGKRKDLSFKEKKGKVERCLLQDGVLEYVKMKKDYFGDIFFYKFTYKCLEKKSFVPITIYVCIRGWVVNHLSRYKFLWTKFGGKRAKIL